MVDVEELLAKYCVEIKSETRTEYLVRCINPEHIDKNASMYIRKDDGVFHCFGCQLSGGYKKLESILSGKAIDDIGFNPYRNSSRYLEARRRNSYKEEIPSPITIVGKKYDPLESPKVMAYLRKCGIYNDQFIKDYGLFYCKCAHMYVGDHYSDENKITMIDRICTPVYQNGILINVEGRSYTGQIPKVLYPIGSKIIGLYNWDHIDREKDVVLVEGIKDLWKVYNCYTNVVSMFHCIPSPSQIKQLKEVKGSIIAFIDNDHGGGETLCALRKELGFKFKVCKSSIEGADPNDCSIEEIAWLISHAQWYSDYLLQESLSYK